MSHNRCNSEPKPFFNLHHYSDVEPFELVTLINPKKAQVRAMTYTQADWKPEIHTGGFFMHCSNQGDQKWQYESAPDNPLVTIRLHKDGQWRDAGGCRYVPNDRPVRFYDFNF